MKSAKQTVTPAETKHTPGPWKFYRDHPQDTRIAYLRPKRSKATWPSVSTEIAVIYTLPKNEANARLIEAAPDILEALKCMLAVWNKETRDKAAHAIRKAEGQ